MTNLKEIENISSARDVITELVGNNIFNYTPIKDLFSNTEQKLITEKLERILVEEMVKKDINKYINRKRLENFVKGIKKDILPLMLNHTKTKIFEEHEEFKNCLDKIMSQDWLNNEDMKYNCINELFDSTFFWNYEINDIFAGKYDKIMNKWKGLVDKIDSKNIEKILSHDSIDQSDFIKLDKWYRSYQS